MPVPPGPEVCSWIPFPEAVFRRVRSLPPRLPEVVPLAPIRWAHLLVWHPPDWLNRIAGFANLNFRRIRYPEARKQADSRVTHN